MTIKVYMLDTDFLQKSQEEDGKEFAALSGSLSKGRQQKIQKFRFFKGRALSLGAGLLLDYGLNQYGLRERDVVMAYGADEKPYLPDYPKIHFNLSHSGSMAMAAFADREVGCDVEQRKTPAFPIVKRFFTREETEALESQTGEKEKAEMFYRFWTLKESFLKVTGKGIRMPLNDFSISLGPPIQVKQKGELKNYGFWEYSLPGYQAAVCVEGPEEELSVEICRLSRDRLLSDMPEQNSYFSKSPECGMISRE